MDCVPVAGLEPLWAKPGNSRVVTAPGFPFGPAPATRRVHTTSLAPLPPPRSVILLRRRRNAPLAKELVSRRNGDEGLPPPAA